MSSLFGSISISLRALLAQEAALQATSENIANVNTPGYARRRAVIVEDDPIFDGRMMIGNGAHLQRIASLRDRTLELRMHEETQQQGEFSGYVGAMSQVESLFSDVENGIGAKLDAFFQSLTRLTTDPASIPLRQNVLTAARNVASSFSTTAKNLGALQRTLDTGVVQAVADINTLTAQIASLNVDVARLQKLGSDAGAFEDQRTQLIRQLSELVDVSVIDADDGVTLTTAGGASLVVSSRSFPIETHLQSGGFSQIVSQGRDITADISGGQIGGLLRTRDTGISALLADLNRLASSFVSEMNSTHRQGFDGNGIAGQDLFSIVDPENAAASMSVALSAPAEIAASSDGSIGDGGNLAGLRAIANAPIIAGQSPLDFYSGVVARLGNDLAQAKSEQEASGLVLRQLANQRASVSGVSLDEEAANLIRYQRAFEAAARVVSIIDDLTETAINLGRN